MKLKFRSKFNHGFTNHGYLHSDVWKALYNFKIKWAQEARNNQFRFQNVRSNEIFEIFKIFKKNSLINVYCTTQKANACSPWTVCSVFDWKYPFWVNLVQKLKNVSLSWNLVLRLIQICRMFTFFCFSLEIPFWANLVQKNQNCQFELKFGTYTNLNMKNLMVVFTFSVLDKKNLFGANLILNTKIVSLIVS